MRDCTEETAMRILTAYLEHSNSRKTPERFAVLKAAYGFRTHFSIQELLDRMAANRYIVSRGTAYNAMRLFMRLNLVVCHRLRDGLRYEACNNNGGCRRICTVCGKEENVLIPGLDALVEKTHLKRFRKERYTLFIYGVCSACQAVLTRKKKKKINNKTNKKENGKR